ncbi:MAG: DUF1667 domain-containing protein [Clostridia bacterium]|nr:DUF1667 domain-containing protein [Clostridia bacterium]
MNTTVKKTCIVCPMGCHLEAEVSDNGEILSVSGNTCKRGDAYIRTELTDPRRTLTSTVRLCGAGAERYLPVKTTGGISKARLMEAMKALGEITVTAPVTRGDVIVKNFLGEGADLVAGKTVDAG